MGESPREAMPEDCVVVAAGSRARRVRERERWRRRGGGEVVVAVSLFGPGWRDLGAEAGVCVWGLCWGTGAGPGRPAAAAWAPGAPDGGTAWCSRSWLPAGTDTASPGPGARWHPEPCRPGGKGRPPPCLRAG